ncbi:MAG TPA: flagellar biosynthesis anti-sigma factor FlgM [Firmicutes bacterium]|nr:flagellar biosynthesis anti-sigma factor FlgM [Bacillota bacterium]
MIISNKAVQRIAQIYQEQKQISRARQKTADVSFSDEVELSAEGKEMQVMLQKLKDAPAIRPQAEEIKKALKSDTYEISTRQIARGILKSFDRG